jgi:ribosomal protein L13E
MSPARGRQSDDDPLARVRARVRNTIPLTSQSSSFRLRPRRWPVDLEIAAFAAGELRPRRRVDTARHRRKRRVGRGGPTGLTTGVARSVARTIDRGRDNRTRPAKVDTSSARRLDRSARAFSSHAESRPDIAWIIGKCSGKCSSLTRIPRVI